MNKECTHNEYYAQFVNAAVLMRVSRMIGLDKINASKDEHFNDIPLPLERLTGQWLKTCP